MKRRKLYRFVQIPPHSLQKRRKRRKLYRFVQVRPHFRRKLHQFFQKRKRWTKTRM